MSRERGEMGWGWSGTTCCPLARVPMPPAPQGTRAGQSPAESSPECSKAEPHGGVTPGPCTRVAKIRPLRKRGYLSLPRFSTKPDPVFLGLTFSPCILGLFNFTPLILSWFFLTMVVNGGLDPGQQHQPSSSGPEEKVYSRFCSVAV